MEKYFQAAISKGIDDSVIVKFFELDKISSELKTLDLRELELGYKEEDLKRIISVPEDLEHIYTADLIKHYHERSRLFEVNLIPISETKAELFDIKARKLTLLQHKLKEKIAKKSNPAKSSSVKKLKQEVSKTREDLLQMLIESPRFTSDSLTIDSINTGEFEKMPESYLDYNRLTVGPDVHEWLKVSSPYFLLMTSSKINRNFKSVSFTHWRDLLLFHFANDMKTRGLKIPHRLGEGFIVRLLIYIHTILEDKDLQCYEIFRILGIDLQTFKLFYYLDTDCVLNNVQLYLQKMEADPRDCYFALLIHVNFR